MGSHVVTVEQRPLHRVGGLASEVGHDSEEFRSLLQPSTTARRSAEIVAEAGQGHIMIAEAIVRADPVAAVEAAERHLRQVEQRMLSQPGTNAPEGTRDGRRSAAVDVGGTGPAQPRHQRPTGASP